jgi:hypothetical protein
LAGDGVTYAVDPFARHIGERRIMSFLGRPPEAASASQSVRPMPAAKARISPGVLVWGIGGTAALIGLLIGLQSGMPRMDAALVPLLRFMAVLKAGMAIGAAALVQWRLQGEAGAALKWSLLGATALMMAAPGLIWELNHIILGAVVFHTGLVMFLVAAARDGFGIRVKRLGGG